MTDTSEFIAALQKAEAYDHPVENITLLETHISWVLLTGRYAYKIKKPVNFGFLDFSTLEKRKFYCKEECRLNGRLAPHIYLGVTPICGSPTSPKINGTGPAFEYAVKMRQFDTQQEFDELLKHKALTERHIIETANVLANFHRQIDIAYDDSPYGTPEAIEQPVVENFAQIAASLGDSPDEKEILRRLNKIHHWSKEAHAKLIPVLQARKQAGFVRECHGDLHLRNIVVIDGRVTPFDGIEFNANLRWVDVMSELAFLLMDLDDHACFEFSRQLLNSYLSITGDYGGLAVLRYYLVYRAMVRAKVASLRLAQLLNNEAKADCLQEIKNYIDLAFSYTITKSPKLIITHGLSGSGKTYVAQQLAKVSDLIHLRSDIERKRIFELAAGAKSDSDINSGIYTKDATVRTYQRLSELSHTILSAGFSVLVDATFLKQKQRNQFHTVAASLNVPFTILHCEADDRTLHQRIQQRLHKGTDASEANIKVLKQQLQEQEPLQTEEKNYTITTNTTQDLDFTIILKWLETHKKTL
jgi:hypothetical protein